jgi:hypothetical protein
MAVIPYPPYSPYLSPFDLFLFPKMKLKPKGRRFDTIEKIQAESQREFRKRSKNGGDGGTGVFMRKGTTSRVMSAERPYSEFCYFYSVSPEYFRYTLVMFCPFTRQSCCTKHAAIMDSKQHFADIKKVCRFHLVFRISNKYFPNIFEVIHVK